jgi:hypothetical protein
MSYIPYYTYFAEFFKIFLQQDPKNTCLTSVLNSGLFPFSFFIKKKEMIKKQKKNIETILSES